MRKTTTLEYKTWWRAKQIATRSSAWTNKASDCRLETLGQPIWDKIYRDHLGCYDIVRDLPTAMDRQMGIDALILTPRGTRAVQEKVRTKNNYADIGIESQKRDPSDRLGCADYCVAQYYSYAEYDPETKAFSRWIILHWAVLADTITPREISGTNAGGGAMHLYDLNEIRSRCPAAIVAQSGYFIS